MPSDNSNQEIKDRIALRFSDHIKHINSALDKLVPEISLSAEKIVTALLSENKILVCGNGSSTILCQYFASEFINRFETERPALPAIALSVDNSVIACICNDYHFDEVFARQVQALGQKNDILLVFVSNELTNSIVHAVQAAHEQDMQVIIICGESSEDITPYIEDNDQIIQIPLLNPSHILELQLLSVHCICDLIDHLLFGTP
ncbi:MAG: SIS domain-containing protein [Pseudomonadota bacterium]